jgi:hypothetical protein
MDVKELLNWVSRQSDNAYLIEVYAVKSLDSGMQFPLGKLPPNKILAVKELLKEYGLNLAQDKIVADSISYTPDWIPESDDLDAYWWFRKEDSHWNLGVRYVFEGEKFDFNSVAKIVNVDFTVSLEELEAKLYNGGTD